MKETHKTAFLWGMAAVVLLLCLAASALAWPPPFSSYMHPSEEIVSSWNEAKEDRQQHGKLDANTATKEQLMTLPGMTAYMADDLLYLRKTLDGACFSDLTQWLRVKDVTPDLLEKWEDLVFCG